MEYPTSKYNHNGFLEIKSRFDMKLHSCKQVWKTTPAIRLLQLDEQTLHFDGKPWCWFDNRIHTLLQEDAKKKMHFNSTTQRCKVRYLFSLELHLGLLKSKQFCVLVASNIVVSVMESFGWNDNVACRCYITLIEVEH